MVRFHPLIEWMAPYREAWDQVSAVVGEPPIVAAEVPETEVEEG